MNWVFVKLEMRSFTGSKMNMTFQSSGKPFEVEWHRF